MSPTRRPVRPLTLVTSSGAAGARDECRAGRRRQVSRTQDWTGLMVRAQDGDRHAYRALLEDVTPFLRALALRCFKDACEVEDAVQDVLLTIHAVRHTYDPRRPFGPWLVAIANRRIIDRLRHQMRARARDIEFAAAHETFWPAPANLHADETSSYPGDEAALHAAIENLPPDQRQAIRLLKLKELTLKEAALASGRSVAALKVATHRAIKSLRKLLQQPSDPS